MPDRRHWIARWLAGVLAVVTLAAVSTSAWPTPSAPARTEAAGPHRIYLPDVSKADDPAKRPTTLDLITTAEMEGTISSEMALLFRTYAAFGDARLPIAFQGVPAPDDLVLDDVQAAWSSISASTRVTLTAYLLPPPEPGSWYDQRRTGPNAPLVAGTMPRGGSADCVSPYPGWSCVTSPLQRVKVWWEPKNPGDGEQANAILAEVEDRIWPVLTGIMQRTPLRDDAYAPRNGGDGLFDIYLLPRFSPFNPALTFAFFDPSRDVLANLCRGPRASFINLANDAGEHYGSGDRYDIIAHEFMHALQWASKTKVCQHPEYRWLKEAIAVWAEGVVYPKVGHPKWNNRSFDFYNFPELPLDKKSHGFGYGSWLFPLYVERTAGGSDAVRRMWDATATNDSLLTVNSALSDGLAKQWPAFLRSIWNQKPFDDFGRWQGVTLKPLLGETKYVPPVKVEMGGQPTRFFPLPVAGLPRLSARYFQFTFPDETARSVTFDNTLVEATDAAVSVQALVKVEGKDWEVRDWTYERNPRFCRDAKDERLEELVIIIGNHAYSNGNNLNRDHVLEPSKEPRMTFSNIACWRWTGTVDATFTVDQSSPLRKTTETLKASVTFGAKQPGAGVTLPEGWTLFRVLPTNSGKDNKESKVEWTMEGGVKDYPQFDKKGCTVQRASETVLLNNGPKTPEDGASLTINTFGIDPPDARRYDGGGSHFQSLIWGDLCPGVEGPPLQDGKGMSIWWRAAFSSGALASLTVKPDGTTIEGTSQGTVFASDGFGGFVPGTIKFTWKFTGVRE